MDKILIEQLQTGFKSRRYNFAGETYTNEFNPTIEWWKGFVNSTSGFVRFYSANENDNDGKWISDFYNEYETETEKYRVLYRTGSLEVGEIDYLYEGQLMTDTFFFYDDYYENWRRKYPKEEE